MEFIIWIREKNGSAWDRPCVWVSVATVEGAESLEHAQRLSDVLHAIGVQHKIRLISRPEMATISPKFEQGYFFWPMSLRHAPSAVTRHFSQPAAKKRRDSSP